MPHSWLAYLPPHLAADLLAHPESAPIDRALWHPAVALFADLSGFTPMSEALGQVGAAGTEQLSAILNRTFGAMIDIIHTFGGSIGKFAGDALTVVFPYLPADQALTVQRAIQCGLDIQTIITQTADHHTAAGVFRLTMKIGVGMGNLLTTTVGDPASRLDYLLAGSAIDQCVAAEQQVPTGTLVVGNDLLPVADAHHVQPVGTAFSIVSQLRRRPSDAPAAALPVPSATMLTTIRRYLPPLIAERLARGQPGFVDEHRMVTTLFLQFAAGSYQDSTILARLHPYLRGVVQISAQYGGALRQIDVGDS